MHSRNLPVPPDPPLEPTRGSSYIDIYPWDEERVRAASSFCADKFLEHLDDEQPPENVDEPTDPVAGGIPTLRGELGCFPISGLLEFLAANRKTGTLQVDAPQQSFTLALRDGAVVHAVCEPRELHEQLGSILLDRGATNAEDLARLIRACHKEQRRLGELLTGEGIVSPEELRSALEFQVQLLFHRLLRTAEGNFEFVEFDPPHPPNHVQLGVMRLLLESARINDETS